MPQCANALSLKPRLLGSRPPLPRPRGWIEHPIRCCRSLFPTNGKAVANVPVIFLALQYSGTLSRPGLAAPLELPTRREGRGGEGRRREGEGNEVKEEKEGEGRSGARGRGRVCDALALADAQASSPLRCPRG